MRERGALETEILGLKRRRDAALEMIDEVELEGVLGELARVER